MSSEGSVYQRKDGRWCAQYRDAKDKTRYIYRKTKAEAKKALREALKDRNDGIACETTSYDVPARDETFVAAAIQNGGSASPDPEPNPLRRDRDMLDSGASGPGPVLTLPDGSCIPDYPNKRNGYCYR